MAPESRLLDSPEITNSQSSMFLTSGQWSNVGTGECRLLHLMQSFGRLL